MCREEFPSVRKCCQASETQSQSKPWVDEAFLSANSKPCTAKLYNYKCMQRGLHLYVLTIQKVVNNMHMVTHADHSKAKTFDVSKLFGSGQFSEFIK